MTCCRGSAIAAVSAAVVAIVALESAAGAAEPHNQRSSVPWVYSSDGSRPDPVATAAEVGTRRSVTGLVLNPAAPRLPGEGERAESGCGWSPRLCGKPDRLGGVPVADAGKQAATAGGTRLEAASVAPPGGAAPYKMTKIAAVSGQLTLPAPESFGRGTTVAGGSPVYPGGSGASGFSSGTSAVNEETAPGPYAMLLIGLSLAAFMAFRRLADG